MTRYTSAISPVALALVTAGLLVGCELTETCDPAIDPNCTADSGVFVPDAGTDVVSPTGCGTLGEGQSRCLDGTTMQTCSGGSLTVVPCSGTCANNACAEAIQYVRIVDVTNSISGQHPGADIDAIALQSGGQTVYASSVTDSFIPPGIANLAPNVTEILGPPDVGPNTCDLTDGAEHWVSLAGGEIVVTFGRALQPGDRITVYECAGAAQDAFDLTIGVSSRLEGDWTPLLEEATGTISATVP